MIHNTLFIVATPIGNLGDISQRAISILGSVDFVVAEDSRRTGLMLHNFQFSIFNFQSISNDKINKFTNKIHQDQKLTIPQLITIHEHSKDDKIDWLIGEIKKGKSAALCTDAGTPGIADPGGRVVEKAIEAGINVVPIPGPSSLSAILSITGWLNEPVLFLGYLPKKKGRQTLLTQVKSQKSKVKSSSQNLKLERRDLLGCDDLPTEALAKVGRLSRGGGGAIWKTLVLLESPHRINKTIQELCEYLGENCQVVIGRELTKQFETIYRGTLGEMAKQELPAKGEYLVAIKL